MPIDLAARRVMVTGVPAFSVSASSAGCAAGCRDVFVPRSAEYDLVQRDGVVGALRTGGRR